MIRTITLALALLLLPNTFAAEVYDEHHGAKHIIEPMLGQLVQVDVLVWDYNKGLQGRTVMVSGHELYCSRRDLPQGKLMRLTGTLTTKVQKGSGSVPPAGEFPPQTYSATFNYLHLQVDSVKPITKAEFAYPSLVEN